MKKLAICAGLLIGLCGCYPYGYYGAYYGRYDNGQYDSRYGYNDGYYGSSNGSYYMQPYYPYSGNAYYGNGYYDNGYYGAAPTYGYYGYPSVYGSGSVRFSGRGYSGRVGVGF